MRRIDKSYDIVIRAVILVAGLLGAAIVLWGCQGGPTETATSASGDCAGMQAKLTSLHGQGKSGTDEYKALLNAYLAKGCQR